jgi:hypothetical protein
VKHENEPLRFQDLVERSRMQGESSQDAFSRIADEFSQLLLEDVDVDVDVVLDQIELALGNVEIHRLEHELEHARERARIKELKRRALVVQKNRLAAQAAAKK